MHEVAIMQSAVETALEQARLVGASRISVIRLRVGVLAGVVADALEFACSEVTRGTPAEGARLEIETVAASAWCPECQREFPCNDYFAECPSCRTECPELRRGRELQLSSLEIL
jgi:hydrogenase nickel incorporation protein HypA/HybF